MTKLIPVALFAAAALTACGSPPQTGGPSPAGPAVVTNVHPYQAGNGVVQSVHPVPGGASAGSSSQAMQRLEIKMDNGKVQYVDTPSREFTKGTRVSLSEDKTIKKM